MRRRRLWWIASSLRNCDFILAWIRSRRRYARVSPGSCCCRPHFYSNLLYNGVTGRYEDGSVSPSTARCHIRARVCSERGLNGWQGNPGRKNKTSHTHRVHSLQTCRFLHSRKSYYFYRLRVIIYAIFRGNSLSKPRCLRLSTAVNNFFRRQYSSKLRFEVLHRHLQAYSFIAFLYWFLLKQTMKIYIKYSCYSETGSAPFILIFYASHDHATRQIRK